MSKLTAFLVGLTIAATLPCTARAAGWQTGTAKAKITPSQPMWMAGYGSRNHPATGLLNDLWARALVLEDEHGTRGVIVSLDLAVRTHTADQRWATACALCTTTRSTNNNAI